jgi:hypothetical protein
MRSALEHNGSVTSLDGWFDRKRLGKIMSPPVSGGPNEARPVTGHAFGLDLSPADKAALISFLKTL